MCTEYLITTIVAGVATEETKIDDCPEKPASGNIKDCPKYKFIAAGSSRQKKGLPDWAKKWPRVTGWSVSLIVGTPKTTFIRISGN